MKEIDYETNFDANLSIFSGHRNHMARNLLRVLFVSQNEKNEKHGTKEDEWT